MADGAALAEPASTSLISASPSTRTALPGGGAFMWALLQVRLKRFAFIFIFFRNC